MKCAFAPSAGALAFAAALVLSGCSKSVNHPPQASGQADQGPAWKLIYASRCTDSADDQCVARYNFTVTSNHTWEVGPGPAGQVKTGQIADADFADLDKAVADNGGLAALKPGCSAQGDESAESTDSSVKLTLIQRTSQAELCTREGDAATPAKVVAALAKLAERYYPLPFPDACEEATNALHALYDPLKSCQSDAECVYVSPNFNPITPGSAQFVITDSCQVANPLIVANNAALLASQAKLIEAYSHAQEACGNRMIRSNCTSYSGFNSGAGAPVCQQGACVISPSAVIEH